MPAWFEASPASVTPQEGRAIQARTETVSTHEMRSGLIVVSFDGFRPAIDASMRLVKHVPDQNGQTFYTAWFGDRSVAFAHYRAALQALALADVRAWNEPRRAAGS